MDTLSMDLRRRILDAYDRGDGTRQDIAERYDVSLGMVKKLLQQRRRIGDIKAQHHRSGRKKVITDAHRERLRQMVADQPDITLEELRDAIGLDCTVQAIFYALKRMDLTLKKRPFRQPSNTAPTSK
jgi:transposase